MCIIYNILCALYIMTALLVLTLTFCSATSDVILKKYGLGAKKVITEASV